MRASARIILKPDTPAAAVEQACSYLLTHGDGQFKVENGPSMVSILMTSRMDVTRFSARFPDLISIIQPEY